ncbi:twin-arginine translocation signal domain protein [Bacterioplanes sanyensis]|uniref:Twin-arginine translocation signal domain protein n=1 Tax=Bacterioplanes sanyensis TaxID=1249553 RepID=A0A222FHC1_9GAMM|nr:amidohydrolase [Bacterioplanes sanyensis]ASP38467.1 twin-arginine translocation signal domain protein [Bacterioplanes sanyensis]
MTNPHTHTNTHTCAQCACHNPLWRKLETDQAEADFKARLEQLIASNWGIEQQLPTAFAMYSGGTIRPMIDGQTQAVEAIGFAGGKVVAVGSYTDVSAKMRALGMQPQDHIQLADGHTLLPGLIEPHVHIVPTAMTMSWPDLGPYQGQHLLPQYDPDTVINAAKQAQAELGKGEWLLGTGVDPALMPFKDGQLDDINIDRLDAAFADTPVYWLSASLHTAYINTAALQVIAKARPESERDAFVAQVVSQGALQELQQMGYGFDAIPTAQKQQLLLDLPGNIYRIFKTANERGVTMMFEAGMRDYMKRMLQLYQSLMPQNVRVGFAQLCESVDNAEAMDTCKAITESDLYQPFQAAVKLVSDGSNQGLTGYQCEQYSCNPENNYGVFNFSTLPPDDADADEKPNYQTMVNTIINKGWPLMIHANGNHAVDLALDVYENALQGESGLTLRHRIEHCSLLSDYSAQRMQDLGISPSFLIGHVGYWGYAFDQVIFKQKAQQLDRCQTMLQLNARITLHSDLSVSPIGPLRMMEQAVTRIMEKSPDQAMLNPEERVTREQGLRAITYDAAWQCHTEQWLGSLAPGKLADFVILAEDPLTIADDRKLRDIPVLQTWVGESCGTKKRWHTPE